MTLKFSKHIKKNNCEKVGWGGGGRY
jgi:hypothetical protein